MKKKYQLDRNHLEDAAIVLNLNPNYFYVIRTKCQERFNYIRSLDRNNLVNAYNLYEQEKRELYDKTIDMDKWLRKRKLSYRFSRILYKKKIYNHPVSFQTAFKKFMSQGFIGSHKTIEKYEKILKIFNEFKNNNEDELNIFLNTIKD